MRKLFWVALVAFFSALIIGCGGGSSSTSAPATTPTPTPATVTYTIGGTVSGLNGSLTIKNNAADELVINSSGQFTFATPVTQGGQYNVTITTQPSTQTCVLSDYFGTNVTANITTVSIGCTDNPPETTTLLLSSSSMALSVSGLTVDGIASGSPRVLMVTNTGQISAVSLGITESPGLPLGTASSTTCGASLAPGATCTITITPGSASSASASPGTAAVPSTLTINGSNTNSVNADIYVLTYGSIYQSGYIFAINETASNTNSIGGKVLALSDQSTTAVWSATNDIITGITETDITPCLGAYDGSCNTNRIVAYYTALNRPLSDYAAGQCKSTINGYGDWFLPSICEMNKAPNYMPAICNQSTQNIQSNLVNTNIVPLTGYYWSSTEDSVNPDSTVWVNYFASGGGAIPAYAIKPNQQSLRCTRALTN